VLWRGKGSVRLFVTQEEADSLLAAMRAAGQAACPISTG
jgi:hypothetical protein